MLRRLQRSEKGGAVQRLPTRLYTLKKKGKAQGKKRRPRGSGCEDSSGDRHGRLNPRGKRDVVLLHAGIVVREKNQEAHQGGEGDQCCGSIRNRRVPSPRDKKKRQGNLQGRGSSPPRACIRKTRKSGRDKPSRLLRREHGTVDFCPMIVFRTSQTAPEAGVASAV